jgi:Yip1 domain
MNLKRRLLGLLVDPGREWSLIAAEPADVAGLYRRFIVTVAAIPSAALLLRFTIAGAPVLGARLAAARYVVALATPIAAALIVEKLAPRFKSTGNTGQALKLVAYSSAPVWIAGVFNLIPALVGTATIVGVLYGIYLFALGLTRVLYTPREQVVPFMVVCAIVFVVINILLAVILTSSRTI